MKIKLALLFGLAIRTVAFSQNLNFRDTNELAKLLCSHPWICYKLNPNSSFSDKVMDSLVFYPDRTWYKSEIPTEDSEKVEFLTIPLLGTWTFGSTSMATKTDSAIDCIDIEANSTLDGGKGIWEYILVDGHRIKNPLRIAMCDKYEGPFIISRTAATYWNKHHIWQPPKQFNKKSVKNSK